MHDLPHDHEHGDEAEHPLWKLDTITLTSVGIDVGTATSQIIFSQLILRRLGRRALEEPLRRRRAGGALPLDGPSDALRPGRERIDDQALGQIVDDAYRQAGLTPRERGHRRDHPHWRGDSARQRQGHRRPVRRSARRLHLCDGGPPLRGAPRCPRLGNHRPETEGDPQSGLLNIDIGGGTTKLAVAEHGHVLQDRGAAHRRAAAFAQPQRRRQHPRAGAGGSDDSPAPGFDWQVGAPATDARDRAAGGPHGAGGA